MADDTFTPTERESMHHMALRQLVADRHPSTLEEVDTPIVRDMRQTARELGIVALLLQHQRIVYVDPGACYALIERTLTILGVSPAEALANLQGGACGA